VPDLIRWEPMTLDSLKLFAEFECGREPWDVEVANWITGKSEDCAEKDIRDKRCKVYLYRNSADQPIGFTALGKTKGEWPEAASPRLPVAIIPWMGIHKSFHGHPNGPDEIRYSDQIIADVVYKAQSFGRRYLVLFVHPKNIPAIKVYRRNGFASSDRTLAGNEHVGMWMDLSAL
jgi:GNAT superfamily N-acetyltransferase